VSWPQEPFKSKFIGALQQLEMARFTRRYPAVLDTLMRQMLALVFVSGWLPMCCWQVQMLGASLHWQMRALMVVSACSG
jgi:hypothetical protein